MAARRSATSPVLNILRIHNTSTRHFHASCLRRSAKPPSPLPPKTPVKRTPLPPTPAPVRSQQPRSPIQNLKNEDIAKYHYAENLLNAGKTQLYRAPSHVGMLTASYFFGASGIGMAFVLWYIDEAWRQDKNVTLDYKVKIAWRICIAFTAFAGGLSLLRPLHMVRSIDLISKGGSPKLLVQVRRPLPFLKPRQYALAPYAINAENTFVRPIKEPDIVLRPTDTSNPFKYVAQLVSKAAFYVFVSVRKFSSQDGIMKINFTENGQRKACQLDTTGSFLNGGKDLVYLMNRNDF